MWAIVMVGNGRWAKARNLPRSKGDVRNEASLFDILGPSSEIPLGVRLVPENWNRSPDLVGLLRGFTERVTRCRMLRLIC